MIRLKTADALLQAPSRIIPRSVDGLKDTEKDTDQEQDRDAFLEQMLEFTAEADTRNWELEYVGELDNVEELIW